MYSNDGFKIRKISEEEGKRMIKEFDGSFSVKPLGLFYFKDSKNGKHMTIDNVDGELFVEEFDTFMEALKWISGELTFEDYD